eukprot:TRINITY_DN47659_c0_g1_i1.p1 TRINITY_DN47659_c0_g1~~TRINITY_DN47659_c0_g1_i1.p1  ORF type:complete len:508 (+),score=95.14 TRINITY_DN47659_c0_g1_i1:79-1602(+)
MLSYSEVLLHRVTSYVILGATVLGGFRHLFVALMSGRIGDVRRIVSWIGPPPKESDAVKMEPLPGGWRLFSWEHSYFSGKVRAYMRYKSEMCGLKYEDVLATPEIIHRVLKPVTGSRAVPQVMDPDGRIIQDSSEIIDAIERAVPDRAVLPPASSPRQRLTCLLIELLADEWLLVPAYWYRWMHGRDEKTANPVPGKHQPNHARSNEQNWGAFFNPTGTGAERRASARLFFDTVMYTGGAGTGVYNLGVTDRTHQAWTDSTHRFLALFEKHFNTHDYVLGGKPSLADFALIGPLYAHLYRDAATGYWLRTKYPLVSEWVERTANVGSLNARTYSQKLYHLDGGKVVSRPANTDGAEWLPNDEIPATITEVLRLFFAECWPVLESTVSVLRRYIGSPAHSPGDVLPGGSFGAEHPDQRSGGPLTHDFVIGGIKERRMVLPYHVWMLQRVDELCVQPLHRQPAAKKAVTAMLRGVGGSSLLNLSPSLEGCRVQKTGGVIRSVKQPAPKL